METTEYLILDHADKIETVEQVRNGLIAAYKSPEGDACFCDWRDVPADTPLLTYQQVAEVLQVDVHELNADLN